MCGHSTTGAQGLPGLPAPISPFFYQHYALCLSLTDTRDQKIKKENTQCRATQSAFFDLYNLTDHQHEANMVMSMQTTILASLLFQKTKIISIIFQDWGFVLLFKVSALLRIGLLSLMVTHFSSYTFLRQSFFTFRAEQDFAATLLSFWLRSTLSFLTIITTEKLQSTQKGKHKLCYDSFIRLILINIPQ